MSAHLLKEMNSTEIARTFNIIATYNQNLRRMISDYTFRTGLELFVLSTCTHCYGSRCKVAVLPVPMCAHAQPGNLYAFGRFGFSPAPQAPPLPFRNLPKRKGEGPGVEAGYVGLCSVLYVRNDSEEVGHTMATVTPSF